MQGKFTSRKFWGAVIVTLCSLYLALFQHGEPSMCATAIAAAWVGYSVAEGYVDGKREESSSSQTINTTSVTATSASQKVVEQSLLEKKAE